MSGDNPSAEQLRTCCFCGKTYAPKFPTKEQAMAYGNAAEREQWLSGCCSDECWNASVPEDDDD